MANRCGTVRKADGDGIATVFVEILPSDRFRVRCDQSATIEVHDLEGKPLSQSDVHIMCMSGARYARHLFPLNTSQIVIRRTAGTVLPEDLHAFGIATVLAIGCALASENSIPAGCFHGTLGHWKACPNNSHTT